MDVSCHRHFFLVLLLNQQWSPPLRLQASHCSTFRIVCDVPSTAVFYSESIECFPGTFSKFFPYASRYYSSGSIYYRYNRTFHIRCIYIHKLLYFNFFSASFCTTFLSAVIAMSISVHVFSLLFLIIISGLFAVTSLSVCTAWFHNAVTSPSSHTLAWACVCTVYYYYYYYYYYNPLRTKLLLWVPTDWYRLIFQKISDPTKAQNRPKCNKSLGKSNVNTPCS